MKKLLGTALSAAVLLSSGPANAELLKNLKVNGGLDLQMVTSRNVDDFSTHATAAGVANNDRQGGTLTRTWLSMGWDLLDDVHAKTTIRKNDRTWGTAGAGGQGAGTDQAIGAGGIQANIYVSEANVKIDKVFGHFDATLGRQYYGEAGDLIIYYGPKNNYGLVVTNIDAARVDAANDWIGFSGLAGKTVGSAIGATAADVDVHGFDVGVKPMPIKTNAFVWRQITHATGALGTPSNTALAAGTNDYLWVYGLKVKGEAMGGWAAVTVAANAGQNRLQAATAAPTSRSRSYSGKALLVDAGWKADVSGVGGFTPWLNFGWGSGQSSTLENRNEGFTAIASDYRPGLIYGKFDGAIAAGGLGNTSTPGTVSGAGLNNRVIWGVGLKVAPAAVSKLTAGLSYWDFRRQRATSTTAAAPAGLGNKHIGSEIDVTLDWKHSDNVMFGVGAATFQPGGFVKESIQQGNTTGVSGGTAGSGVGVSPVTALFGDVNIRF